MDLADKAKRAEEFHVEDSLASRRLKSHIPQLMIGGEICCVDCYDPIDKLRLRAQPDAVRCVDCQQQQEIKEGRVHGH